MKNIVYVKPGCAWGRVVKELLDQHRVDYEERVVSSPEQRAEMKREHNFSSFPMVFLNGHLVGGYNDTKKLVDEGRLEEVLGP